MPCDCSHMEYGYSNDDRKYGPHTYLHAKREEILAAGGVLLAVHAGIIDRDDNAVRSFMASDPPMKIACRLADRARGIRNSPDATDIETDTWIMLHEIFDAARVKREEESKAVEQRKREALNKLTAEERRILGLQH